MRKSKLWLCLSTAAITLSVFIFAAACHKDTSALNSDDNGGYASDNSKMEQNSNDVVSIADVAVSSPSGTNTNMRTTGTTGIGHCATITHDTAGTVYTTTINFGTADCPCLDGKNRRGSIVVTYTGNYFDAGSVRTITYDNYYVNDNQLMGKKVVTNVGLNSSNQDYYSVQVNDTLNLGAGNGEIVWSGTRTRTWLTGYNTPTDRTDDSYLIGGTTTLTRANGNTFVMTISTPLQVAYGCEWIEAGIVSITGPGGGTRTLNYGSGNCDSEAQLTLANGKTYNITLR